LSDTRRPVKRPRTWVASRRHRAFIAAVTDRMISLALILGRPVCNNAGLRIGRVDDIVVRLDRNERPPVTGVLVSVRSAFAIALEPDLALSQTEVRLRSDAQMAWRPVWEDDDVALARDVLDRRLIDTFRVQVVRAADVYLLNGPQGWELAGIDVGARSFGRRLVTWPRACPPPDRLIDWAQLQLPRFTDTTTAWESQPTIAASDHASSSAGIALPGLPAAALRPRESRPAPRQPPASPTEQHSDHSHTPWHLHGVPNDPGYQQIILSQPEGHIEPHSCDAHGVPIRFNYRRVHCRRRRGRDDRRQAAKHKGHRR
jgi:sporulation protein YlmC with PRC-barrel domain